MDRNEVERRINILKQYYDPNKANYQKLENLITKHASYYEIVVTLEEIQKISNTPDNIVSFIEVLKKECKELHNIEMKNQYERQTKEQQKEENQKEIKEQNNQPKEQSSKEAVQEKEINSKNNDQVPTKKMTYLNLNIDALVQYIKEAKVIAKPNMTFNIIITTTDGKDRKISLFFAGAEVKPNIPGVEVVYNDTQTFDNKLLREIINIYLTDNKPTQEEVEEEKGNYLIANETTNLKLQDMNIEAITSAQLYVEIITSAQKPSGPIHIRRNSKEAAKGNIFVILIVLILIIVISALCIVFYKLSA